MRCVDALRAGVLGAIATLSLVRVARADVIPEPFPGNREVVRTVAIDTSALPPDQVLLFALLGKKGGIARARVEPFHSPYRLTRMLPYRLILVVAPRSLADTNLSVGELEDKRLHPTELYAPPTNEVPESDQRWSVERKARISANGSLEVLEDVVSDREGTVICRRSPIDESDQEEGLDPCDPSATSKRVQVFFHIHERALQVGSIGMVALTLAGLFVLRRRKRSSP